MSRLNHQEGRTVLGATGWLVLVAVVLFAGLFSLLLVELARDRAREEASMRERLTGQAELADVAISERVRKIDYALQFMRGAIEERGLSAFGAIYGNLTETGLLDVVTSQVVTDADGRVLLVNGKTPTRPLSFADREHFKALRDGPDALVIGKPLTGRISGESTVPMGRKLRRSGKFAGAIYLGIRPEALLEMPPQERGSGAEVLTLMSHDGVVLSRSRDMATYLGKRLDDDAIKALHAADSSYAVRPSPTDGLLRAHALRHLRGLPLYIAVGDTFDVVDANLAPRRRALIGGTLVVAALLGLLFWQAGAFARRRAMQVRSLSTLCKRLELAQEVAGVGSWIWHVGTTRGEDRIELSDQVLRMIGVARADFVPRFDKFIALVPEAERQGVLVAFRALLKDGGAEHEHHVCHVDGELRHFIERARVIERDESGRAMLVIGSVRDVTESRRLQALLAARERRLDAIVSSLAEGIIVRDRRGRITFANDAAARLAGLKREELIGRGPDDAVWDAVDEAGQLLPRARHPSLASLADGRPFDHQLFGIRGVGGQITWVSASTRLLAGGNDEDDAVVASFANVSRLKEADREGRLAAAVFAQVSEPIMITDASARILRVNRAFTEIFGFGVEEVVGKTPSLLRSQRHDEAFYSAMWRQLAEEGCWRGELWNRRKDGEVTPVLASITRISEPFSAETRFVAAYADLAQQKRAEEELRWAANHDALTGLPNRTLFHDRLQTALVAGRRRKVHTAVAYIDLDGFKPVNDTHGHLAGDFVLQMIADRMRSALRASDTVARIGGDEFAAILVDVADSAGVRRALHGLLLAVAEPVDWEGAQLVVGASIGVAMAPDDADHADTLIEAADAAMYRAKAAGRGRVVFVAELQK